MKGRELVEFVARRRIEMIANEVKEIFSGAEASYHLTSDGRAHIVIVWEGAVIGEEFVETGESWSRPERMREYLKPLVNKARLVVVVPERHVRPARMRLLEFNQWWYFYYLVFSYDPEGRLKPYGRPRPPTNERGYA
ncbi:MAG: hypothetical protein LUO79_08215 [Methanomassiliicoccales archaeon]|nr:hypothetical protein [Methanomassiliicoccales archaeon]